MGALAELLKLGLKTAAKQADEVVPKAMSKEEGGQVLPVIKKEAGGDFDFGLSADDMAAAYEAAGIDTSSPSGYMDDTDAGLYADAYGQPTTNTMSNEDFMSALTGTDTRYNPLQSPEMKAMTSNPYYFNPNAPKDKEEADRQAKDVQLFENFKHYGVADPVAHMTPAEQKNAAILEMIEHNNRLAKEYNLYIDSSGRYRKGNFGDKDEYYKVEKFGGGQVLDGLDGAYMRKRNSKEKLEGMIGIQSRQYGGGLDDAYMNRRRSSAFADPNATSAFASPMSMGGLPTIYREQGGPLPITSVYGQGIPRIVYRENGGGLPTIYRANGGGYEADDFGDYSQADLDAAMDTSNADAAGDFGDEGGSYQDQMEAALSGQAPGTSKTADELLADTSLGYTPFELATIYRGKEGKDNQETAKRMAGQILSRDARTALMNALYGKVGGQGGWHGVEDFIYNMTPQQLQNFNMAANGSSLFGDMGADDFSKGWRYGGAEGTLQDILEKSLEDEVDISDLLETDKQGKELKKDAMEQEAKELSTSELSGIGLLDFAKDIQNKLSIQSNLDPTTISLIETRAKEAGFEFQPVNSFIAGAMDYGIPLLTGLPGTIAKGLSNLTGAGRTIGTVTKDGLSYNLSDTGKFSLNLDPQEVDYGNDPTPVKKRKPVQKAVASTTEEKPKERIAAYYEKLNKARPAQSRVASNKYIEDLLEDLYLDPRNRPTLG